MTHQKGKFISPRTLEFERVDEMKSRNNRSGFTLIELLVVIAIIAILAAILFPVFAQAKMAAKKTADLSNLKQIATSIAMYTSDYDDYYPFASFCPVATILSPHEVRWSSSLVLGPYIKNTSIFSTPGDLQMTYSSTSLLPTGRNLLARTNSYVVNSLLPTWAGSGIFPPAEDMRNDYLGVFPAGPTTTSLTGIGVTPSSTTAIANPADVIMLAGGAQEAAIRYGITPTATNGPNTESWYDLYDGMDLKDRVNGTVNGVANAKMKSAWEKFNGVSNFAFPDGHAKSMSPKALKTGPYLDPRRFIRDAQ